MLSTPFWSSLNYLLQSYTLALDSVSSLNCALSMSRILAGLTFLLVRNLTVLDCATTKGTTCSLIVMTIDKKEVDAATYYNSYRCPSLTASKVNLFYTGISA
jgi:hypothetical protein